MSASATIGSPHRSEAPGCGILAPFIGAWRSLVARTVRVGEVPGSNPGAPIENLLLVLLPPLDGHWVVCSVAGQSRGVRGRASCVGERLPQHRLGEA